MNLKLKEIRLIRGMSQQTVADYLHCSAVCYSRYETGNRCPSLDLLIQMADCFDVTVDYLLAGSRFRHRDSLHMKLHLWMPQEKRMTEQGKMHCKLLQAHSAEIT